ncbi:conserved hypothetical protein [Bathymodiolus platifrons methanotrophic gill symbiont]|uniref:AAA family ATPase n=1 Tax=Bathymodiolus platifrons methanotrophic gill symbiont TaxID=113268 RepID=UPI000B412FE8|nr:AAA family ATPase [Bathymodiolus platifrons methanotrophic gill symbiont]GAW86775.1 conserved hypothetical protein [Bathymodiolus platifrons methanotrophic gill symbiont]GFO76950.1 hypothetical protein BPLS_P5060 [Bathymodiolus platifrons methanotrophic gill symbiont]
MLPKEITKRPTLNRRLGIKSSLSKPKLLLSGIILLWIGTGRPSTLVYADTTSDGSKKLKINQDVYDKTEHVWGNIGDLPSNFKCLLEKCPIFDSQMEPLQVALELIWKLCTVSFIDSSLAGSYERSGGIRKLKQLEFTSTLDILNEVLTDVHGDCPVDVFEVLISWLKGEKNNSNLYEKKLLRVLTNFTEDTHFKLEYAGEFIEFQQEGIYQLLERDNSISLGNGEKKGPLRIFNSILNDELHPYLTLSQGDVIKRSGISGFDTYKGRVSNYLNIIERNQSITIEPEVFNDDKENITPIKTEFPLNWIIYGAPGTGKSHFLEENIVNLHPKEVARVTFYSDYTYGQFVGGFRPAPLYDPNSTKEYVGRDNVKEPRPGKPIIEYRFVPGTFLKILVQATKDKSNNRYLLIIEELNRADAPAVFGDIFQLLDRSKDGESKYPIYLSTEAIEYLISNGIGPSITIPSNLYIWATLNNADQGVIPLDTAFKRRWSFFYMGLNDGENALHDTSIKTKFQSSSGESLTLEWNDLRQKINIKLSELRIHEDMHIGPFFLTNDELCDDSAFKFKLLSYIRDDILRHRADEFFSYPNATLSELLSHYSKGNNIFQFPLE